MAVTSWPSARFFSSVREQRPYRRRPPLYDADGFLSQDTITKLVRRIWFGSHEVLYVEGWRIKCARLSQFYPPQRWPPNWPIGAWIAVGDGLEATFGGGILCVRRR